MVLPRPTSLKRKRLVDDEHGVDDVHDDSGGDKDVHDLLCTLGVYDVPAVTHVMSTDVPNAVTTTTAPSANVASITSSSSATPQNAPIVPVSDVLRPHCCSSLRPHRHKRARRVAAVAVQTVTAVTVGAIATWSALAFS